MRSIDRSAYVSDGSDKTPLHIRRGVDDGWRRGNLCAATATGVPSASH